MPDLPPPSRRTLVAGLILAPATALAAVPQGRRILFQVLRNGAVIGEHAMTFSGDGQSPVAASEVTMTVKGGPVTLFRYRHTATERWSQGRFASLETRTVSNGKVETVAARRTDQGVAIETAKGRIAAPAGAAPFTHWNAAVLTGPLFNPQEGKLLKVTARKSTGTARLASGSSVPATVWSIRGEAEIDDFYDADAVWIGLKGKLKDGSTMEYRRV